MTRRSLAARCAVTALPALLLAALPDIALAQAYPSKPVRILSTIPLSGSGDIAIRLAATKASETFGQTMVVETNNAAGGTVAARTVMKSPPDGYTLFHSSNGALAASLFTVKDLGYHPIRDFSPITLIAATPSFMSRIAFGGFADINLEADRTDAPHHEQHLGGVGHRAPRRRPGAARQHRHRRHVDRASVADYGGI